MYKILMTEPFERAFSKLDHGMKIEVENIIEKLEQNPYTGKPLRYNLFREKRIRGYRVYYLIYDQFVTLFIVGISNKKDQETTIQKIIAMLQFYFEEVQKRIKL